MDSPRGFSPAFSLFLLAILCPLVVQGTGVFSAKRRLGAGPAVADIIRHDEKRIAYIKRRHERSNSRHLSAIDFPIGGGLRTQMWYADIAIGTPPKHFEVHIDTASADLWLDCEGCDTCIKSDANVKLETYNPKLSKTARIVMGDESLCDKQLSPQNSSSEICDFDMTYEDGSGTRGYYVTDLLSFNQVSSNPTSGPANVTFGCATMRTGDVDDPLYTGTEGLIGLSAQNSYLAQMASVGKVRKEFAHCFDFEGGIFAIGHVVKPKVAMVPLLPGAGYNVYRIKVTAIEVGGHSYIHKYLGIVDTGCYLIHLPEAAYEFIIEEIFLKHPNLTKVPDPFTNLFPFPKSVIAEFPTINIHVNATLVLKISPHDYFLPKEDGLYFGLKSDADDFIMIGDFALRNKLFIYDLENYQIGLQDYNCSSSIEVEGEGGVCNIGAHKVKSHGSHEQ